MKKLLTLFLSLSLLTACGSKETSSDSTKTASIEEVTEIATEALTEKETEQLVFYDDTNMKTFDTFEEFKNYMNSDEKEKEFAHLFTDEMIAITGGITVFEPVYDESKYEFRGVTFVGTSYTYSFRNLSTDAVCVASISKNASAQTFEEMVESANANLVVDVENTQTTVWGDTPALIQTVPFSNPTEYALYAMIDENNCVYFSGSMTPEELTATLNDFKFE